MALMADLIRRGADLVMGRRPRIATNDVVIGEGVRFGRNVRLDCRRVRIGDGAIIGDNVTVKCDTFEVGDFAHIYDNCFFPGPGELRIGHNFWLGIGSIVDSLGGTTIGNNVGIGAHSQLWTHIKFGDTLEGSRFDDSRRLTIGDDVWFVGHCLVSPITAEDRSMAMLGSVVTRDMAADHIYAGVPARDVTDKLGRQFEPRTVEEKAADLEERIRGFGRKFSLPNILDDIVITDNGPAMDSAPAGRIVFNVRDRTYRKTGTQLERRLIRYLLPEAKFVPG